MQIYVIERPDGLVKIGRSNDPTNRVRGIASQGGFEISRAWMSLPDAFDYAAETRVHHSLDNHRTIGEWFDVDFDHAVSAVVNHWTPEICEPISFSCKENIVTDQKALFSQRLNKVCDDASLPLRGRRAMLAQLTGVSGEAARKWLSGEAIPAMPHVAALATHFGSSAQWLLTGHDDESNDGTITLISEVSNLLATLSPTHIKQAIRMLTAFTASIGDQK